MSNSDIQLRQMNCDDVAAAMDLVRAAGWNQTEADWDRFLDAGAEGCFVAECDGRVCGATTTIVYTGQLAWVSMVLVTPERRGQGIGSRLLKKALEHLDSLGRLTVKLDATRQGRPIYERLGFKAEYEIERWALNSAFRPKPAGFDRRVVHAGEPDLDEIIAMDRTIFGADRNSIMRSVHREAPEFTVSLQNRVGLAGFALGRHGLNADHLGPWIAIERGVARVLLETFLSRSTRPQITVDCVKAHPFACELLRAAGFEFSRPLTRMVRGTDPSGAADERLCAILGPEFG